MSIISRIKDYFQIDEYVGDNYNMRYQHCNNICDDPLNRKERWPPLAAEIAIYYACQRQCHANKYLTVKEVINARNHKKISDMEEQKK